MKGAGKWGNVSQLEKKKRDQGKNRGEREDIRDERERERAILKFGIWLCHIDLHGVLLAGERERDLKVSYHVQAHGQAVCFADFLVYFWLLPGNRLNSVTICDNQ